jgi:hypothetical protein
VRWRERGGKPYSCRVPDTAQRALGLLQVPRTMSDYENDDVPLAKRVFRRNAAPVSGADQDATPTSKDGEATPPSSSVITWDGVPLLAIPLADGTSYYLPNFCRETGLDATAMGRALESTPNLWLSPSADYMKYRGNQLNRIKFFVNLDAVYLRKYTYPGSTWESTMHFLWPEKMRARSSWLMRPRR